ncbi:MAG: methyltransferase [Burkholderiales bacterium]
MAAARAVMDRLYATRNRLVGDPGFRRFTARMPLTRPIARRKARAAFDLTAGFVYSQVLQAAVRLGLLRVLAERPQTVEVVARRIGVPPAATARLLEAAVALDLAADRGEHRYGLGETGAAIAGDPAICAMIEHHAVFYRDLADPVGLLRGTVTPELRTYWAYASADRPHDLADASVASYSALMADSQSLIAGEVTAACDLRRHACLLDVGGGEGAFVAAAAAACPDLRFILFDLPAVVPRAQKRLAPLGLGDRVRFEGGDFKHGPLPRGADVATLVRVLHDHDDDVAAALLAKVRAALAPGGTVVIAEPMADGPGAARVAAYFAMYFLAMGSGRLRDFGAQRALLENAGFTGVRRLRTALPLQTSVVTARAA